MLAVVVALALSVSAPSYDVPAGFTRCPDAVAWHGFFKWASQEGASCGEAARFMRRYAAAAGGTMPRRVAGHRCRVRFWRTADGDVFASRHTCTRGGATIRFYGMV